MRAIKTFMAHLRFLNFLGGDSFDHKIEVSVCFIAQFYNKKYLPECLQPSSTKIETKTQNA